MVLNATFNNISVISWRSVLETGVPGENHRLVVSHWQILSHNVVSSTPRHEFNGVRSHNVSGNILVGTDCTGSCKSNYHTITTTTVTIPVVSHLKHFFSLIFRMYWSRNNSKRTHFSRSWWNNQDKCKNNIKLDRIFKS